MTFNIDCTNKCCKKVVHINSNVRTLLRAKKNAFQVCEDEKRTKNFTKMIFKHFHIYEDKKHFSLYCLE